jgi:hypothetical protein
MPYLKEESVAIPEASSKEENARTPHHENDDSSAATIWKLLGIVVIAIVVFRLWDIPIASTSTVQSHGADGTDTPFWMQFATYTIIPMLLNRFRWRAAGKQKNESTSTMASGGRS